MLLKSLSTGVALEVGGGIDPLLINVVTATHRTLAISCITHIYLPLQSVTNLPSITMPSGLTGSMMDR